MSETTIKVPYRFEAIGLNTPLANASDIYDTEVEKNLQSVLKDTRDNIVQQESKIDSLNTIGEENIYDGVLTHAYGIGDIFYIIESVKSVSVKHYYVAKVDGSVGDNLTNSSKFIDAGLSSMNAISIKTTVIKTALKGDDAYEVYKKNWIEEHPNVTPVSENGCLTKDEWLTSLIGDSAYEIAVSEGFEGTKSQWLASLKGQQGNPGVNGRDAVNPFKGWFNSSSALTTFISSPKVGDYAYVKGATSEDPAIIYECTTAGTWSDSDRTVDPTNVQTFKTGESVNEIGIDSEPSDASDNLVKSGIVKEKLDHYDDILVERTTVNLFDKTKASKRGYVNRNNGNNYSAEGYFTTDFIPIDSSGCHAALAVTGGNYKGYACYDASYNYTHGSSGLSANFVEGDAFVKFSGNIADINSFMVVKGNSKDYPSTYVPHIIGELKDEIVDSSKIKNNAVTNEKIKDGDITLEKTTFGKKDVSSKNFLNTNDEDYIHQKGYYINRSTGAEAYASASNTTTFGRTGYIPVSKKGMYCNASLHGGAAIGGAVYNSNKQYIRALPSTGLYTYVEGDAYVRFSLKETPKAPYTPGQLMVWEGDATTQPTYDEYSEKTVIDEEYLPNSAKNTIDDGSISYAKLASDVKNKIIADGVEICVPNIIPCVVGDTLRIYYRSIIKAPNPYIFDVIAVSSVGYSYPRYYEYKPTSAGNKTITIYVKNASQTIIAQKSFTIKAINHISSPSSNKNILMLGASTLADGVISDEVRRRLCHNTGDNTPSNPTGLNLNNITFVGRLTGTTKTTVHQEANSGWSWKDYATVGRKSYKFNVTGVDNININDKYVDDNDRYVFTIIEINVTGGVGTMRCTYSGSGELSASGTLTIQNGLGDSSITYSSCQLESRNPFWDNNNSELDFNTYVSEYCDNNLDLLVSYVGYNSFTEYTTPESIQSLVDTYIKPFINAFHEQLPNAKFAQCALALGSPNGGMAVSYHADSNWNYYNTALKVWSYYKALKALEEELETTATENDEDKYFYVFDTFSCFDCETLYPTTNRAVANRSSVTEQIQTNGLHCTDAGKLTIADSIYQNINYIGL